MKLKNKNLIISFFSILSYAFLANFCINLNISCNYKILIGSPIKQNPKILKEFLESLKELDKENLHLDYCFIDDNTDKESQELLNEFVQKIDSECTIYSPEDKPLEYKCNDDMQYWSEDLIWRNSGFKNFFLNLTLEKNYDYLFLLDSNLILNPKTLTQLIKDQKDIASCLVWQETENSKKKLPQVWLYDTNIQYEIDNKNNLKPEQIFERHEKFLNKLTQPGIYKIGGLGSCTLISKNAIESGINFNKIKNLSIIGEDKHFSIRADALGIDLFVDTYFPAHSINREKDLIGIQEYKNKFRNIQKKLGSKVTLSMIIRNDANRYLTEVLEEVKNYIDEAVIIDDGSTDNSSEICSNILKNIPVHIIKNDKPKYPNEIELRKQQWEETIKTDPDWILNIDPDKIFEKQFRQEIKNIINQNQVDLIYFRAYDFWDKEHYREDKSWLNHKNFHPFLCRYKKEYNYNWSGNSELCCRFPESIMLMPCAYSKIRVKNFSWTKSEDRFKKYQRYLQFNKTTKYNIAEQYESVFDLDPNLVKWIE